MSLVAVATPAANNDPAVLNVTSFPRTEGNRLIIVATHRAGFTGVSISPGTWTQHVANHDYTADSSHRRGVSVHSVIIDSTLADSLDASPFISVDHTGATSTGVACFCAEVTEGTGYEAVQIATGDNGDTGATSSVSTGTTASVSAGDLLVVTGVVARGGTSLTATNYNDTESSFNEASSDANSACGAMYLEYLPANGGGTFADTITFGINREASAAITVFRLDAGDVLNGLNPILGEGAGEDGTVIYGTLTINGLVPTLGEGTGGNGNLVGPGIMLDGVDPILGEGYVNDGTISFGTLTIPGAVPSFGEGISNEGTISYGTFTVNGLAPGFGESTQFQGDIQYGALFVGDSDPVLGEGTENNGSISYGVLTVSGIDPGLGVARGGLRGSVSGGDEPEVSGNLAFNIVILMD